MRCRRPLVLTSVVAVAAFSLLAAGCGGRGSPRVASVASSTTEPHALKATAQRLAASNPRFTAAARACNHLLPNAGSSQEAAQRQRTQLADELSFARCMRSHGVSRFPDPSAQLP